MQCATAGDLGDIIAMMCVMRDLPNGPHTLILQDQPNTAGIVRRRNIIAPLAESQSYIKECRPYQTGDVVNWSSADFRTRHHTLDKSLVYAHGTHAASVGLLPHEPSPGKSPWIHVEPDNSAKDKIIIGRSTRYRNCWFPWQKIVDFYGTDRLLFVGMPDEHADFCFNFGQVEYRPTNNLLEVARLIAGSLMFIGNQSCPYWCAQAMHHRRILEVCLHVADSICAGGEAQFIADGFATLPTFDGGQPKVTTSHFPYTRSLDSINTSTSPPGGWHYKNMSNTSLSTLIQMAVRAGIEPDYATARTNILEANIQRRPDFFKDDSSLSTLTLYRTAMAQQGFNFSPPTV